MLKTRSRPWKARLMAWYAHKFDSAFPLAQMLGEEASEVKDYLTLHRNSTLTDVKETALALAKRIRDAHRKFTRTDRNERRTVAQNRIWGNGW